MADAPEPFIWDGLTAEASEAQRHFLRVDTETYLDASTGLPIGVLVLPADPVGGDQTAIAIARSGDVNPRLVLTSGGAVLSGDGTSPPVPGGGGGSGTPIQGGFNLIATVGTSGVGQQQYKTTTLSIGDPNASYGTTSSITTPAVTYGAGDVVLVNIGVGSIESTIQPPNQRFDIGGFIVNSDFTQRIDFHGNFADGEAFTLADLHPVQTTGTDLDPVTFATTAGGTYTTYVALGSGND